MSKESVISRITHEKKQIALIRSIKIPHKASYILCNFIHVSKIIRQ